MITRTLRRYLSLLLAFFILLSCFHLSVFAEESEETTDPTTETTEPVTQPTVETTVPETQSAEETTEPSTQPTQAPTEPETQPADEPTEPETQPAKEPTEPPETEPTVPNILPIAEEEEPDGPGLFFGQLHAHSETDTLQALFQTASQTLDFYAVTQYSDGFDNPNSGRISETASDPVWITGKAAAKTASNDDFTGIFGFELNWPEQMQIGHLTVFNTPGFQSWLQDAYGNPTKILKDFYDTLAAVPDAVVQWNHPGNQYGTFFNFDHHSEAADRVITLLEVAFPEIPTAAEHLDGYGYYTRALDKGWHVAPTNSQGSHSRTVICAQTCSESGLYDAMRSYRVYATEDSDLEIVYTMDGYPMGSILKKRHTGQSADIIADLYDPTDSSIGLVEVIVDGGTVAAAQTVSTACDVIRFSLAADYSYYYLRITQSDGDIAVTAPVWLESEENLGISDLTCDTPIPVQNEEISLVLDLYNHERADFLVESVEILADGIAIAEDTALSEIPAGETVSHDLTFRYGGIGQTEITVILTGTLDGMPREYEKTIPLSFRLSEQVTDILIDGSHGNAGLSDLSSFQSMAAKENIRLTVAASGVTKDLLKNCRLLMVTAPGQPFSADFLTAVTEYIRFGGSILICGQSAALDGETASAAEANRLLEAIGSSLRLNHDSMVDSLHNGGTETLLFLEDIRSGSPWTAGLSVGQVYRHNGGCSVSPGTGIPLVTGRTTTQSIARSALPAALAFEETPAGGTIFAAGSLLPGNAELNDPANIWDLPYANRTIVRNLLGIGGEALPLSTIRQARDTDDGTLLRIRGYVTAGTANSWNSFPNTLYVQDDTGGIAVTPFRAAGVSVGTPVEITGTAQVHDGNRTLKLSAWEILDASTYRYLPQTGDWNTLLDTERHGGELVQVEGKCTEVMLADDGYVSRIVLQDKDGNYAHVLVEDYIFSGSDGENNLHKSIRKDRTVRAAGILHVDEEGDTVIRVRNCEEVVYVPPWRFYVNPRTEDPILISVAVFAASAAMLILLKKKRT